SVPYDRVTEFKYLTGQDHPKTGIVYEYPIHDANGDPYYPVPRPENAEIYRQYKALADDTPGVYFVGRLATYKYYYMDQVTAQALAMFKRIVTGQTRNVAVALVVVESISHDEHVRDSKPDVSKVEVDQPARRLVQQRAHLQRRRLARAQAAQHVVQRQPGVDDVFDDQDVPALDRVIEILEQAHHARGIPAGAAGDGQEIHRDREAEVAEPVGKKDNRCPQQAHQHGSSAGV